MGWNYLSIRKLQRMHRWSYGMNMYFHSTCYRACDCLSIRGLKLTHVRQNASDVKNWMTSPHRWLRFVTKFEPKQERDHSFSTRQIEKTMKSQLVISQMLKCSLMYVMWTRPCASRVGLIIIRNRSMLGRTCPFICFKIWIILFVVESVF